MNTTTNSATYDRELNAIFEAFVRGDPEEALRLTFDALGELDPVAGDRLATRQARFYEALRRLGAW